MNIATVLHDIVQTRHIPARARFIYTKISNDEKNVFGTSDYFYFVSDLWKLAFLISGSCLSQYTTLVHSLATQFCTTLVEQNANTFRLALTAIELTKRHALRGDEFDSQYGDSVCNIHDILSDLSKARQLIEERVGTKKLFDHVERVACQMKHDLILFGCVMRGPDVGYLSIFPHTQSPIYCPPTQYFYTSYANLVTALAQMPGCTELALELHTTLDANYLSNFANPHRYRWLAANMSTIFQTRVINPELHIAHMIFEDLNHEPPFVPILSKIKAQLGLSLYAHYIALQISRLRNVRVREPCVDHHLRVMHHIKRKVSFVPSNAPNIHFGTYLALDAREQAVFRDLVCAQVLDSSNKDVESNIHTPTQTVETCPTSPITQVECKPEPEIRESLELKDPRDEAMARDRGHRNVQYTQLLDTTDRLWHIVSQTEQALDLDKNLGHAKLSYKDRQLLTQRHAHMTALHYDTKRKLYNIINKMALSF